ncbi:type III secretion system protein PrgD, partial [Enterococcus faecalis]
NEVRQMKVAMEKKNNNYQVTEIQEEKEFSINE